MAEQEQQWLEEFSGAAPYRILVQGVVPDSWKDRLAGMNVVRSYQQHSRPHTELAGLVRDQTELNGVFETLYSLHLTIIRVERIPAGA